MKRKLLTFALFASFTALFGETCKETKSSSFLLPTAENESIFGIQVKQKNVEKKIEDKIVKKFVDTPKQKINFTALFGEMPPAKQSAKGYKIDSLPVNEKLDKLINSAYAMIGTKYHFGAQDPNSEVDCSLYTQSVFKNIGIDLPRTAVDQSLLGKLVSFEDLKIGDLLFFRTYKEEPSHVGIYIGENKMIHASFGRGEVIVESIMKGYFQDRFLFAKRQEL